MNFMEKEYLLTLSNIRELREARNISQKAVAHELGVDASVYSRMEGGQQPILLPQLFPIARILKASLAEVLPDFPNASVQHNHANSGIVVQINSGNIHITIPESDVKKLIVDKQKYNDAL